MSEEHNIDRTSILADVMVEEFDSGSSIAFAYASNPQPQLRTAAGVCSMKIHLTSCGFVCPGIRW